MTAIHLIPPECICRLGSGLIQGWPVRPLMLVRADGKGLFGAFNVHFWRISQLWIKLHPSAVQLHDLHGFRRIKQLFELASSKI